MPARSQADERPQTGGREGPSDLAWILLIYVCSGTCSLIDEVVFVRLIKLTLGNTVYASTIVVSTFMGGLALGALVMSRYADRIRRPLRAYAILEIGATLAALSLPVALGLLDGFYRWVYADVQPSPGGLMAVQVLVSAALLLVPSMLMGSTLPLLGRYVARKADQTGQLVGKLYAANTLGAAVGCFLAGFFLIRALGVTGTLLVAAGLNLAVALGGWVLSRRHDESLAVVETEEPVTTVTAPAPVTTHPASGRDRLVLGALFASGFMSIGYELVWMRSVVIPLGGFTYVFAAVLTVYLLGNVAGAALGSRLSQRLRSPSAGFGVSLLLLGALGISYMPWLSAWQSGLSDTVLRGPVGDLVKQFGTRITTHPMVYSLALFLLPSIAMGVGFPLALQSWGRSRQGAGRSTGVVYSANTLGAVLGGILTGFVLVPHLGAQLSVTLLGLLGAALGLALVMTSDSASRLLRHALAPAAAFGLVAAAWLIPGDLYLNSVVSKKGANTVVIVEGPTTTVAVRRRSDGAKVLLSDGINVAGDDMHRTAQKMLGHLGLLVHPDGARVLSIGFGSGETTACLALHDPERIDCVEIASELVDVALEHFDHINLGSKLHDKVNMLYMDARNYLHVSPERYDLIINGADIPAFSGSAPLFTKEHFQNALDHLEPNGLFMTKVHLGGMAMSRSGFDSILGTFRDVFPHVTLWYPSFNPISFCYLMGSADEQRFPPGRIAERLAKPAIAQSMAYLNVGSSAELFACYIADEIDIGNYLGGHYKPNTDDTPFVEFNTRMEATTGTGMHPLFVELLDTVRQGSLFEHIDWTGVDEADKERQQREIEQFQQLAEVVQRASSASGNRAKLEAIQEGFRLSPDHPAMVDLELEALYGVAPILESGGGQAVAEIAEGLLAIDETNGTAWLLKARALRAMGDQEGAMRAAQAAVTHAGLRAHVWLVWLQLLLDAERPQDALDALDDLPASLADTPGLRGVEGRALAALGRWELAEEALSAELSGDDHADAELLVALGEALVELGREAEAVQTYAEASDLRPDWTLPLREQAWILATCPKASVRDAERAVLLGEQARDLTGGRGARALDVLAAAYASAGRRNEAVTAAEQALDLAKRAGKSPLAEGIAEHLEAFRAGDAWGDGPNPGPRTP